MCTCASAIDKLEQDITSKARAARKGNDTKAEQLVARLYGEVERGLQQRRYASLHQYLADHARTRSCCSGQARTPTAHPYALRPMPHS